jgi:hypothetical protein
LFGRLGFSTLNGCLEFAFTDSLANVYAIFAT